MRAVIYARYCSDLQSASSIDDQVGFVARELNGTDTSWSRFTRTVPCQVRL